MATNFLAKLLGSPNLRVCLKAGNCKCKPFCLLFNGLNVKADIKMLADLTNTLLVLFFCRFMFEAGFLVEEPHKSRCIFSRTTESLGTIPHFQFQCQDIHTYVYPT